jgi:transcriptional regulator with XRE-family HTH domain
VDTIAGGHKPVKKNRQALTPAASDGSNPSVSHEPDPDHPDDRARIVSPLYSAITLGMRRRSEQLRAAGVSVRRVADRSQRARELAGLSKGTRSQELSGMANGRLEPTLQRLDHVRDLYDLPEVISLGRGLPSPEDLALYLTAILAGSRGSSEQLLEALRAAEGIEAGALELVERRRARMALEAEVAAEAEVGRVNQRRAAVEGTRRPRRFVATRKAVQP